MSDDIDTEIQRAERNTRKLRALQAENERASEEVARLARSSAASVQLTTRPARATSALRA